MISIRCESPNRYTQDELEQFRQLVQAGGEVSAKGLADRIDNAEKLATAWFSNELIAVGAIKRPLLSYQRKVFAGADVNEQASDDFREIGWLFTVPEQRGKGVGNKIMEALVEALPNRPCFATTRANNDAMNYVLPKFGLQRSGNDYPSKNGEYMLMLFLKTHG